MSSRPALVSVLVPTFNAARYLPEFCRSLQAQTYPHFEVILANDGSTDDTLSVLSPFLEDPRFRLVSWAQNRGLNQGWATLCALASGEYWCSPGADDVLYPSFLERRVARLEANAQAALVHGQPELIDESGKPHPKFPLLPTVPNLKAPRSLLALLQHNFINQPSALVRTNITKQILPFFCSNWVYAPDWFFWILHAATGYDLVWDGQTQHQYRIHSTSLTSDPSKASLRRAEIALAPLCALGAAARFSSFAVPLWLQWRKPLYHRWLGRALRLSRNGQLKEEWLRLGAAAFYQNNCSEVSLLRELCKHGLGVLRTWSKEQRAARNQSFPASGLAQINDPLFR